MSTLAIIDYGMGNLHSVASAIKNVAPEVDVSITADKHVIADADRVIFPGVGAIRDCIKGIYDIEADVMVKNAIASGKPVLGICVGLQALMARSEENGGVDCLNVLPGNVKRFSSALKDVDGNQLKVPHMGWNQVEQVKAHPLWENIPQNSRFYFVHSYYVSAENAEQVTGKCEYGVAFDAVLSENNLFAAQFHPEKSHTAGLQLLQNFVRWNGTV
ncbi:imidazole glycerol phosphate synthase subunit HisH [Aurantivibrio plasticivorans]